ncbi:MAG: ABC transporter permease [Ignavibacteriota bacterium]
MTASFLGIGLLIAALADNVPAVQALGQCIFLPMIMIGGVGVPLGVLPLWAQRVAGFMPGRYAVEVLQPCFTTTNGLHDSGFRLGALAAIDWRGSRGHEALPVGGGPKNGARRLVGGGGARLVGAVGAIAWETGRLKPVLADAPAWTNITEAQIAEIQFDGVPGDSDLVAPLAPSSLNLAQNQSLPTNWRPGVRPSSTIRARVSAI